MTKSVFHDLEFENPDEWQAKADLALGIMKAVKDRGWNQKEGAKHLHISETEMSNIYRGQFDRFTLERLMSYLCKLDTDVEITLKPRQDHGQARLAVTVMTT